MKRVLSIQDLSCLGKCSLTVALPVLSAMECSCSVLPTAVLSTHTGFLDPYCRSLTEDMEKIADHWLSVGAEFDGISVGYLSDPKQAEKAKQVLKKFGSLTVIDPVMGDHGKLYSGMGQGHVQAMKKLCAEGQVLLPNLTEAALLTDLPYEERPSAEALHTMLEKLLQFGARGVVITGIQWDDCTTGFVGISPDDGCFSYKARRIPRQMHGTGDMFSAVTLGSLVKGKSLLESATLAAQFVEQVVEHTPETSPFGAEFETQLPWLMAQKS